MATIDINKVINESIQDVMNEGKLSDTMATVKDQVSDFANQTKETLSTIGNKATTLVKQVLPSNDNMKPGEGGGESWKNGANGALNTMSTAFKEHPYAGLASVGIAAGLGALALRKRLKGIRRK